MKSVRLLLTAIALLPGFAFSERPARADGTLLPGAGDDWVLADNCPAEGLRLGEFKCHSQRWMPASHAEQRRLRAMARPKAGCSGIQITGGASVVSPAAVGAKDLQDAYDLPIATATGAGNVIAVIEACGYTSLLADLNAYRAYHGIPAISLCGGGPGNAPKKGGPQCIGIVDQNGGASLPPDDDNWSGETALDVDMVTAACPACSMLVVESDDPSSLESGLAEAVALGVDAASNSWGRPEFFLGGDPQLTAYPGTLIAAASGDADYDNEIVNVDRDSGVVSFSNRTPNWPASDPNVLSVGGTTLTWDPTNERCFTNSAWNHKVATTSSSPRAGKFVYGGGSGCSVDFAKPSYQSSLALGACSKRASVDVSAVADADPGTFRNAVCVKGLPCGGIAVYAGGGWNASAGTSAATPFVTATLVRMGLAKNPNSYFYTNHSAFTDVTAGNNDPDNFCTNSILCNAGVGWDGPTGWGVPDGYALGVLGANAGIMKPPAPTCSAPATVDAGAPSDGGSGDDASTGDGGSGGDDASSGADATTPEAGTPTADAGPIAQKDAGPTPGNGDGGAGVVDDAGGPSNGGSGSGSSGGCGCTVGAGAGAGLAPVGSLFALAAIATRLARRRRASRSR
jgi:hypothetical protein